MNNNFLGTCLITGGTGFVGQRLVAYLSKEGNKIKLLQRKESEVFETITCNFLIDNIPSEAFQGVDTVFHLAGEAYIKNKEVDEKKFIELNVETTKQLAKKAIDNKVKNFIFLSSVKAQDISQDIYGKSKRLAEIELQKMESESNIAIKIVRSCLIYGPNMKGNLMQMSQGIKQGWFPPLTKRTNKKSLVHVDDLIKAIMIIIELHPSTVPIVVTDGNAYSSKDLYMSFYRKAQRRISFRLPEITFNIASSLLPGLRDKIDKLYSDEFYNSKEIFSLGFKPEFSLDDFNEESF